MRYNRSKSGRITGTLQEGKLKRRKKTISFKIYLLLHFSSNLAQILRKYSLQYKKQIIFKKNKNFMTKIKKKDFFLLQFFKILEIPT